MTSFLSQSRRLLLSRPLRTPRCLSAVGPYYLFISFIVSIAIVLLLGGSFCLEQHGQQRKNSGCHASQSDKITSPHSPSGSTPPRHSSSLDWHHLCHERTSPTGRTGRSQGKDGRFQDCQVHNRIVLRSEDKVKLPECMY